MLYMIMECDDRALLDAWMAQWSDVIDFEVEKVMTSANAVAAITPSLRSRRLDQRRNLSHLRRHNR
jgi:hypothetical protein